LLNKFNKIQKGLFIKNVTLTNIILVGGLTILTSGFGFLKEIVVAKNFGLSELLDAYYIAILFPSFVSNVFLSSYQSVFIPNYVNEQKTNRSIGSFQTSAALITLFISAFFLFLAYLFTDLFLEVFFKGHAIEFYTLVKNQFAFVAPCIVFWGLTSIINGLLNVDNEFKFSTLSSVFTPLSIIFCLLFFKDYFGELVLAIATLIGSSAGFLFVLFIAIKRRIIFIDVPNFKSKNSIIMFQQLPAKITASLLNGINPIVDQYFSAQLVVGSIAALNYGIKIPAFAISIGSMALGNVLLPYFSKLAVEDIKGLYVKLIRLLKYVFVFSSIIAILAILLSYPTVMIIFERDAFGRDETIIVSKIQKMYLLQLPFYLVGIIMIRFLTAINKNNFMVFTSIISLFLNLILNFILMKLMGVYGLALSTSIVSIVIGVILYFYIIKLKKENV
jgi:putative peptidoglycan lipid II flippase